MLNSHRDLKAPAGGSPCRNPRAVTTKGVLSVNIGTMVHSRWDELLIFINQGFRIATSSEAVFAIQTARGL